MVSNSRYCEICGARELYKRGFFARFPKDEQRCKTWVKIVGKKDLVHIPIEKLHQIRHICGDHFAPKDFGKTRGKLKKRAFPKLQLSAPPLSDYQLRGFPQHTASQQGTTGTSNTAAIENVRTLQPVEFQFQFHQYCKGKTTQSPVDVEPAKSESSKLDSDLIDTGDHIETDAFDNDSPPKPVPGLPESDTTSRNIFSWQTAELIEADASDDPTPTPVPEQPKLPDDVVTLSLFCDDDAPIQSESIDLVPSIDLDDVELRCKDCAARIGGYSFWCVQCACGALCDACAGRAPHDTHYVLRAPEGATQNQTQTVLAVIRQQLLKGNLLTLYEIDEDGVKKEVKEETEEPAATTDPLAVGPHFEPLTVEPYPDPLTVEPYSEPLTVEPYPDPLTVEHYSEPQIEEPHPDIPDPLTMETDPVTVEPHPDPLTGEPYPEPLTMEPYRDPLTVNPAKATVTECVDDDTNGGHHPNKRPRLMDDTRMGDIPNSSVSEKDGDVSQQILSHVPHIRRGSQIVQTLAPSDLRSQDVIQTTACNIKGSQDAIANISNLRTQQSVLIVPSNVLRRSQTVQPLATGDLGSQDVIQATTCNVKGSLNALATNSNLRTQQSLLNVPSNVLTL